MQKQGKEDSLPWEPYDGRFCSDSLPVHLDSPLSYLEYLSGKRTPIRRHNRYYAYSGDEIRPHSVVIEGTNNTLL